MVLTEKKFSTVYHIKTSTPQQPLAKLLRSAYAIFTWLLRRAYATSTRLLRSATQRLRILYAVSTIRRRKSLRFFYAVRKLLCRTNILSMYYALLGNTYLQTQPLLTKRRTKEEVFILTVDVFWLMKMILLTWQIDVFYELLYNINNNT